MSVRLSKLENGVCDATFLACAGLKRLGQGDIITEVIDVERMLNAPAQGAVGVETRTDNIQAKAALAPLHDLDTAIAIAAERGFLEGLDGSCRTPIAALAKVQGQQLFLRGEVFSLSGQEKYAASITKPVSDMASARLMGLDLAADIRAQIDDFDRLFAEDNH